MFGYLMVAYISLLGVMLYVSFAQKVMIHLNYF